MIRKGLALFALALIAGSVGCAHCDTCGDFPAPGAGYGGPGTPVFGAFPAADGTPTSMTVPMAPAGPVNDAAPAAPAVESKPATGMPPKPGV